VKFDHQIHVEAHEEKANVGREGEVAPVKFR